MVVRLLTEPSLSHLPPYYGNRLDFRVPSRTQTGDPDWSSLRLHINRLMKVVEVLGRKEDLTEKENGRSILN